MNRSGWLSERNIKYRNDLESMFLSTFSTNWNAYVFIELSINIAQWSDCNSHAILFPID